MLYREPTVDDGSAVCDLISSLEDLDDNSSYAYLMACRNFSSTSVVVVDEKKVVGVILAFLSPDDPSTLFVWQVAVAESHQGKGMGKKMLQEVMGREACSHIRYIETTITRANKASQGLFRSFAEGEKVEITREECFTEDHFPDDHDGEDLYRIGPLYEREEIHIKPSEGGYELYVGERHDPAFEPVNPSFTHLDDAIRAADAMYEDEDELREVIIHKEA